jgi:hypothetical protein
MQGYRLVSRRDRDDGRRGGGISLFARQEVFHGIVHVSTSKSHFFPHEPLRREATNYISILVSETEDGDHDSTMAPSTLTIKATAKRQEQRQRRQKQDEMHDIKDKVQDESEDNDFLEATTTTTTKTTCD